MATDREREVIRSFINLADRLVDDYDVVDLTTQLTQDCARLLDVSASGLLLADAGGVLHLLAATSEQAHTLEAFQLQREEGPCLDCFLTGQSISVTDLSSEAARWPRFVKVAAEQGFASVHAIPLRLRGHRLGALNLFGSRVGDLNEDDLRLAQGLAHVASIAIVHGDSLRDDAIVAPSLNAAVAGRALVEVAKGVLAGTHSLDMQEAFNRLRNYAHQRQLRLTDVARDVVAGKSDTRRELLAELGKRQVGRPALTA